MKMVRAANDEITVGTEHWRSDEWKEMAVFKEKLKPDPVWLRRDSRAEWRKVVVDVMVTSTDKMSKAFKERDGDILSGRQRRRWRRRWAKR